jgi:hypothetical protein
MDQLGDPYPTHDSRATFTIRMANQDNRALRRKRKSKDRKKVTKKSARSKSCGSDRESPQSAQLTPDPEKSKSTVRLPKIPGQTSSTQGSVTLSECNLRRNSYPAQSNNSKRISKGAEKKQSKNKPNVPLLVAIKPDNADAEKDKFMKSCFHASPQFIYRYPINSASMERMSQPSQFLLPLVSIDCML